MVLLRDAIAAGVGVVVGDTIREGDAPYGSFIDLHVDDLDAVSAEFGIPVDEFRSVGRIWRSADAHLHRADLAPAPMRHARHVQDDINQSRAASAADADVVAELLDRFNREYDSASPGPAVLAARLARLLAGGSVAALLVGEPAIGVALLTFRPNIWFEGPVALLDELYVTPEERGHGIGTVLLKATEELCRQRDSRLFEINVDGEDIAARRFYERHGYSNHEPGQTQPQLYYHRDLEPVN